MFGGVRSPENWVGFFTFKAVGRQTIAATGTATCQFYGTGNQPGNSLASVFYYDPDTDMVESGLDGTLYSRSTSVPGIATDGSNPLVGSWEATDGDLTRVEMTILTDGSWESTDTRSAGCEGKGLTYATWSGEGSGTFSLTGIAFVEVSLTTFCHPVGKEKEVHSLDANFIFSYRRSTDTLVLGDRNPVIDAVKSGRVINAGTISLNHPRRGQNVLTNGGVVIWLRKPVVGGADNIWLPKGVVFLREGDQHTDPSNVFLAH